MYLSKTEKDLLEEVRKSDFTYVTDDERERVLGFLAKSYTVRDFDAIVSGEQELLNDLTMFDEELKNRASVDGQDFIVGVVRTEYNLSRIVAEMVLDILWDRQLFGGRFVFSVASSEELPEAFRNAGRLTLVEPKNIWH